MRCSGTCWGRSSNNVHRTPHPMGNRVIISSVRRDAYVECMLGCLEIKGKDGPQIQKRGVRHNDTVQRAGSENRENRLRFERREFL